MKERLVVNPNIHFGKPCIANTRITVPCILELIKEGISFDEIKKEYYPDIEIDDIQACIQYAIDVVVAEDIHINEDTESLHLKRVVHNQYAPQSHGY